MAKSIALTTKRLLFCAAKPPDVSYDAIEERLNLPHTKTSAKKEQLATPPTEPKLMGPPCPEIQSNNTRVNLNLNVSFVVFHIISH